MSWKRGEVLHVTQLASGLLPEEGGWAIVLDDEDMMLYTRERCSGYNPQPGERCWCSRVCSTVPDGEHARLAVASEVPADLPADFWPTAAQWALN